MIRVRTPFLGGFRLRVLGMGPQLGYIFPVGDMQGFLGVKACGEFDAANCPSGWNTWLTFAISPAAPARVTASGNEIALISEMTPIAPVEC
jgi:hypothetical protein